MSLDNILKGFLQMASNFPGPYEIRFFYSSTPAGLPQLTHEQRLNVNLTSAPTPGTPLEDISFQTRGGTPVASLTALLAYLALLAPMYNTTSEGSLVELWKYAEGTFDATFITAHDVTFAGTSGTATVPAGQGIATFRTFNGGVMRLSYMESRYVAGQQETFPTADTAVNALSAFVIGTSNWILGRDNGYPIARLRWSPGQNEALFKRRYRSTD